MCKDDNLPRRFDWHPLLEVAEFPKKVPSEPGVYSLRVDRRGNKDTELIIRQYLETRYIKALEQQDKVIVELYERMGLPEGTKGMYNPDEYGTAKRRLQRLKKIGCPGYGSCSILYLGGTNNLRRRMDELVWGGHTANHAVWPLLVAEWKLDFGWYQTPSYREDEKKLKALFSNEHNNLLPPLVKL